MNRFSSFELNDYKMMVKIYKKRYKNIISFNQCLFEHIDYTAKKNYGFSIYETTKSDGFKKIPKNIMEQLTILQSRFILYSSIYNQEKFKNIFIDSELLYNFLKDTKSKPDNLCYKLKECIMNDLIEENGQIYFPINNIPSLFYTIKFRQINNTLAKLKKIENIFANDIYIEIHFFHGKDTYIFAIENEDITDIEKRHIVNIFVNMILYIDCFPDSITNTPPDDVKKQYAQYIKRCFTIKSDESLIDRSGVTPHFRRGHFRVLRSEVFKKKRYQTIFVHSSFVKGKAKTVLDNSEKEKIMVQ